MAGAGSAVGSSRWFSAVPSPHHWARAWVANLNWEAHVPMYASMQDAPQDDDTSAAAAAASIRSLQSSLLSLLLRMPRDLAAAAASAPARQALLMQAADQSGDRQQVSMGKGDQEWDGVSGSGGVAPKQVNGKM